jgi:hypothetical protein
LNWQPFCSAGRALRDRLVPLAEEVNRVGARGVKPSEIAAARRGRSSRTWRRRDRSRYENAFDPGAGEADKESAKQTAAVQAPP